MLQSSSRGLAQSVTGPRAGRHRSVRVVLLDKSQLVIVVEVTPQAPFSHIYRDRLDRPVCVGLTDGCGGIVWKPILSVVKLK